MAESLDTTETPSGASMSSQSETLTLPAPVTPSSTPDGSKLDLREAALSLSLIDHELNAMQNAGFSVVRVSSSGDLIIVIHHAGLALSYLEDDSRINGVSAVELVK